MSTETKESRLIANLSRQREVFSALLTIRETLGALNNEMGQLEREEADLRKAVEEGNSDERN